MQSVILSAARFTSFPPRTPCIPSVQADPAPAALTLFFHLSAELCITLLCICSSYLSPVTPPPHVSIVNSDKIDLSGFWCNDTNCIMLANKKHNSKACIWTFAGLVLCQFSCLDSLCYPGTSNPFLPKKQFS